MHTITPVLHGLVAALVLYGSLLVWTSCGKACGAAHVKHKIVKVERPRGAR